jgi:hypothetical protein
MTKSSHLWAIGYGDMERADQVRRKITESAWGQAPPRAQEAVKRLWIGRARLLVFAQRRIPRAGHCAVGTDRRAPVGGAGD